MRPWRSSSEEFERREVEVVHQVQGIADAESTVRMAIDLSRPQPDVSIYVNDAHGVAQSHQLDFLDFVSSDGSIISSAEWTARFGYKLVWVTQPVDWASLGSFLMNVDTPNGPALGVMALSTVRVGDKNLYMVGRAATRQTVSRFSRSSHGHARAAVSESLAGLSAE